jgi:hypothetical protein
MRANGTKPPDLLMRIGSADPTGKGKPDVFRNSPASQMDPVNDMVDQKEEQQHF